MTTPRKPIKRLKISMNVWGNFKAYNGSKMFADAAQIYDLAYILTELLTEEEQKTVTFYGTYAADCREFFDKYRNL